jgi:hypothetical protein
MEDRHIANIYVHPSTGLGRKNGCYRESATWIESIAKLPDTYLPADMAEDPRFCRHGRQRKAVRLQGHAPSEEREAVQDLCTAMVKFEADSLQPGKMAH